MRNSCLGMLGNQEKDKNELIACKAKLKVKSSKHIHSQYFTVLFNVFSILIWLVYFSILKWSLGRQSQNYCIEQFIILHACGRLVDQKSGLVLAIAIEKYSRFLPLSKGSPSEILNKSSTFLCNVQEY
jgi:hypothetical protein